MSNVVAGEVAVQDALGALGLSEAILVEVLLEGVRARVETTENDPRSLPGFIQWARTVRALRDRLAPRSWQRGNHHGLEVAVSPNGKIAIAVMTGDISAGNPNAVPGNKNRKGAATASAVAINVHQLGLPGILEESFVRALDPRNASGRLTYVLLVGRGPKGLGAELSLPAKMTDGRIEGWSERICLRPIPLEEELQSSSPTDGPGPRGGSTPDIDVPVKRREGPL